MSGLVTRYLDTAFVFAVTGAALVWPPLALLVGALFFIASAVVADRRSAPPAPEQPQ